MELFKNYYILKANIIFSSLLAFNFYKIYLSSRVILINKCQDYKKSLRFLLLYTYNRMHGSLYGAKKKYKLAFIISTLSL